MRSFILRLILGGIVLLIFACGETQYYIVSTNDGKELVSAGQPELNDSKRTYEFETPEGQKIILNQTEVQSIKERANYPD